MYLVELQFVIQALLIVPRKMTSRLVSYLEVIPLSVLRKRFNVNIELVENQNQSWFDSLILRKLKLDC